MNVSLRQLRAFVAVAGTGSFTGAAKQLHITQSALILLIKDLESELGVRLLDRTTRAVALSDVGHAFFPLVQGVLQDLEHAIASGGDLRDGVVRDLDTSSQASLPWKARVANIRGAFRVTAPLAGMRVVVVDDVMTTGATLAEFARALKAAGAKQVENRVVARTPAPA